jgi:hypothetical protein
MLFNTTYIDNEITRKIDSILGKPYSFLKSIQLNGTGSHRMMITEVCEPFKNLLNTIDINYCSVELRPKGILFHINKGLQNFSWAIPYYKLAIFKSETLSFHSNGNFIKVNNKHLAKKNITFITKIIEHKNKFLTHYDET